MTSPRTTRVTRTSAVGRRLCTAIHRLPSVLAHWAEGWLGERRHRGGRALGPMSLVLYRPGRDRSMPEWRVRVRQTFHQYLLTIQPRLSWFGAVPSVTHRTTSVREGRPTSGPRAIDHRAPPSLQVQMTSSHSRSSKPAMFSSTAPDRVGHNPRGTGLDARYTDRAGGSGRERPGPGRRAGSLGNRLAATWDPPVHALSHGLSTASPGRSRSWLADPGYEAAGVRSWLADPSHEAAGVRSSPSAYSGMANDHRPGRVSRWGGLPAGIAPISRTRDRARTPRRATAPVVRQFPAPEASVRAGTSLGPRGLTDLVHVASPSAATQESGARPTLPPAAPPVPHGGTAPNAPSGPPELDIGRVTDEVYRQIESRLRVEKGRRGL